jgi:hypothetical protein
MVVAVPRGIDPCLVDVVVHDSKILVRCPLDTDGFLGENSRQEQLWKSLHEITNIHVAQLEAVGWIKIQYGLLLPFAHKSLTYTSFNHGLHERSQLFFPNRLPDICAAIHTANTRSSKGQSGDWNFWPV